MSKSCLRSQETCIYLFNILGDSFSQNAGEKGSANEEGMRRCQAAKYNGSHIEAHMWKKPSSWSACTTERLCLLFLNTVIAHDTCIYFSSLSHTRAAALLVWKRNLWAAAFIRVMPHTSRLWLGMPVRQVCAIGKNDRVGEPSWERNSQCSTTLENNPGSFHRPWTVWQWQGVETSGTSVKRQSSLQQYLLWHTFPSFQHCMA